MHVRPHCVTQVVQVVLQESLWPCHKQVSLIYLKILLKASVTLPLLQNQCHVDNARFCCGCFGPWVQHLLCWHSWTRKTSFLADGVQAHHPHALGLEKNFQMPSSFDNSEPPGRRVLASTFSVCANAQSLGPLCTCYYSFCPGWLSARSSGAIFWEAEGTNKWVLGKPMKNLSTGYFLLSKDFFFYHEHCSFFWGGGFQTHEHSASQCLRRALSRRQVPKLTPKMNCWRVGPTWGSAGSCSPRHSPAIVLGEIKWPKTTRKQWKSGLLAFFKSTLSSHLQYSSLTWIYWRDQILYKIYPFRIYPVASH